MNRPSSTRSGRWAAFWAGLKRRARQLKTEVRALVLVSRDRRVPRRTRFLAFCVVAYALSPLDLIPDFIPILGLVDDLILLPLGFALVLKSVPPDVMRDCRERAAVTQNDARLGQIGAVFVVVSWLLVVFFVVRHFL